MRILKTTAAAGLLAASLSSAVHAQDATTSMAPGAPTPASQPSGATMTPMAPSADIPAANSSATMPAAGDHVTVTNGPVPDTPDNRAKYGSPMSHAGKHTKPAGN